MANPEHLGILKQGVEAWNAWRQTHRRIAPDLRHANLSSANLISANLNLTDLTFANLSSADLGGAHLRRADCGHADLSHAHLGRADLIGADLRDALLRDADLREATLVGANLIGADLGGAQLGGAQLGSADLRDADLRRADFSSANLSRADFSFADLSGADFEGVVLGFTSFGDNDLSQVKGMEAVRHDAPSSIGIDTIYKSRGAIPEAFLRGCGVPDEFITYMRSLLVNPIQFYSCFISYSSANQEFAERLHTDLQAKGVRVWYAPHDLPIGARIRPAIDESIRVHDKLLLVLSQASVSSQWVEQEVETAFRKERQSGGTVLFPVRLDDSVFEIGEGWPALVKDARHVGDFTRWKDHDSYRKALERLLRDLKTEEPAKSTYMTPNSLENHAVLSPRDTIREGWKGVESSVIQAARRNRLVSEGERVDCGLLINQLHEAEKISDEVREEYFLLSKWHRSVDFDSYSSVEPQTAINFVNRARELQKALAVDTPPPR